MRPSNIIYMRSIIIICNLLLLNACYFFGTKYQATTAEKLTIVRVTDEYLRSIISGKVDYASSMINWGMYKSQTGTKNLRDHKIFESQARMFAKRKWSVKSHPLTLLTVSDLQVDKDFASITLVKKAALNNPEALHIKLKLAWEGRGWTVIDDNIFGSQGIIASLK